jgi:hypothetical protein
MKKCLIAFALVTTSYCFAVDHLAPTSGVSSSQRSETRSVEEELRACEATRKTYKENLNQKKWACATDCTVKGPWKLSTLGSKTRTYQIIVTGDTKGNAFEKLEEACADRANDEKGTGYLPPFLTSDSSCLTPK